MLIQEILENGLRPVGQPEFDALASRAGEKKMRLFHELFYKVRSEMLESDRESWLRLNRIYPHMVAAFSLFSADAPVFILSTKKPEFIAEILSAEKISLADERIIYSGAEKKMNIVKDVCVRGGFSRATFIDDQIDHLARLDSADGGLIRSFLASWGYVKPEWLHEPLQVPVLTPEEFLVLVRREYA